MAVKVPKEDLSLVSFFCHIAFLFVVVLMNMRSLTDSRAISTVLHARQSGDPQG